MHHHNTFFVFFFCFIFFILYLGWALQIMSNRQIWRWGIFFVCFFRDYCTRIGFFFFLDWVRYNFEG
ncbi:hypothetical protein FPQ18DRAFT_350135 [Pyronema domesticum]|nr:hypothetical protein FPQ18DRAFT_350135 [Pyronema domesticum]